MIGEMVTAGHLGGYVAGGDPATYYPALWDWLVREQGIRSVLDVGCGDGVALRHFRGLGCTVRGLDGVRQDDLSIRQHDFEMGPPLEAAAYDLCWSCEFVEHVEARFLPNVLAAFRQAPLALMTHASPGQAGWHHVNCQPPEYWVRAMEGAGYELDATLTTKTRELAAQNTSPWNHYVRSGLAFRRLGA